MGVKNPLWMGLPRRMRQVRQRLGIAGRQIALQAGCSDGSVSLIERGQVPALDTIERLASFLGISPGWLAFGFEGTSPWKPHQPRNAVPLEDPEPTEAALPFRALHRGCGSRLKESRERQGLSLRALASATDRSKPVPPRQREDKKAVSVSHQTIALIEAGLTTPRIDTLEELARALKVPPSWLAFGEEGAEQHRPAA